MSVHHVTVLQIMLHEAEAAAARHRDQGRGGRRQQDLHQPAQRQDTRQHARLLYSAVR